MMDKYYNSAEYKYVGATVIYVDSTGYAYSDAEKANKLSKDELLEIFLSGTMVLKLSAGSIASYEVPSSAVEHDGYLEISFDDATVYSPEYTPSEEGT